MGTKKTLVILLVLILIVTALAVGMIIGRNIGKGEAEEKLGGLVEMAFPRPPQELKSLSGVIKGISGATINLEVIDPNDYLPHPDGTPQRREIRFATITGATQFTLKDYTRPDPNGNPAITPIQISDLKVGDAITVTSDENIRDKKKFDVTAVQVVVY